MQWQRTTGRMKIPMQRKQSLGSNGGRSSAAARRRRHNSGAATAKGHQRRKWCTGHGGLQSSNGGGAAAAQWRRRPGTSPIRRRRRSEGRRCDLTRAAVGEWVPPGRYWSDAKGFSVVVVDYNASNLARRVAIARPTRTVGEATPEDGN